MIVVGYDCTHDNISHLPPGARQVAGYATGSGGVPWTAGDWAAHPGALRIDQDPFASDFTADYLDIEAMAATIAEAPGWYRRAVASFRAVTRPGQRWPGFYCSASNVTPLVNMLIAGGITSGPRLIIANWNLNQAQAVAEVMTASGPFPVAGVQFRDPGPYDVDVWSDAWLAVVSHHTPPPPPPVAPWVTQVHSDLNEIIADIGETAALVRAHLR